MGGYVHVGFMEHACNFSSCPIAPLRRKGKQEAWILSKDSSVLMILCGKFALVDTEYSGFSCAGLEDTYSWIRAAK